MRSFLGFSIDNELKKAASSLSHTWDTFRLVHPDNYHLTLVFLGDIDESSHSAIFDAANNAASHFQPFTITFNTLLTKRDMLWLVPDSAPDGLFQLEREITRTLVEKKVIDTPVHDFRPHIKLGFTDSVGKRACPKIDTTIKELHLFKSVFEGRGVKYEIVKTFGLG